MGKEYTVGTIQDMARIPEEALPRFLAELPVMLGYVRNLQNANSDLAGLGVAVDMGAPTWVDDDLQTATFDFIEEGQSVLSAKVKFGSNQP